MWQHLDRSTEWTVDIAENADTALTLDSRGSGSDRNVNELVFVSQLTDGMGNWNKEAISQSYNDPAAFSQTGIVDSLVWTKSNEGTYNVKKEYNFNVWLEMLEWCFAAGS